MMQKMRRPSADAETWRWGSYFAGILYTINPFTYDRFMAGQYMVLAGYAVLPFFVYAFWRLYKTPSKRTAVWFTIATTTAVILSIHMIGPMILIAAAMLAAMISRHWRKPAQFSEFGKWLALALVLLMITNSFWIVPTLLGKSSTATVISGFTSADQRAFATDPGSLGLIGNVLSLNGFWGEGKNLYMTASDTYSWWLVPVIVLWLLVLTGVYITWRQRRTLAIAGMLTSAVAAMLAVGTAGSIAAPVNQFLIDHVPFFAGYREPQKFVAVLAFMFAYFGSIAVAQLAWQYKQSRMLKQHWQTITLLFLLIPVLCAPLMPWGFHGQLHATDYPVEWYALNDRLDAECTGNCKVLYVPWHLYMHYDFTGRVIANPAPKFFGRYIVASTDPELDGAASYTSTDLQKEISTFILPQAVQGKDVTSLLRKQHIQYILLAKENDYRQYAYLKKQHSLQVELDTPTLTLYKVRR